MDASPQFEISRLDLQELETHALASITNVKPLTSYNWIEAPKSTPTIAVPGSPALWSIPDVPRRLQKDSGLIYVAQNAARHPESPLEPLFRALFTTHPSFDIRSIDVVTDRNNIRKLLSFIDPSSNKYGLEAFTMNIEMARNTAIFCRHEAQTTQYIGSHEFRGFGHEFEKVYTISQINGSTGHHRIISYRFSDLNFLIRHETDGYVDNGTIKSSKARKDSQDVLSDMVGALSLSLTDPLPDGTSTVSKLKIKEEGWVIPLESTLEIKTRVQHKPLDVQDIAPQLWVSQTPQLVRAYHQNGLFRRPFVENFTANIKVWEQHKQNELRKLGALIRKIVSLVKQCGGNAVVKYSIEMDKLMIYKAERKEMLPKDLYKKWDDVQNLESKTDDQKDDVPNPMADGSKLLQPPKVREVRRTSLCF